ncbi:hypothetical protein QYF61_015729, partial [Mycteria americana]
MCWGLAHAYRALFNTIQYPQGEDKVSGFDDKATGTTATPAPAATGTMATPKPSVTGTAATPNSATDTAKKSWKQKSAYLEREYKRAGPSQGGEEEELVDETETTRSLSLSELRDMRKDFSCRPGEHVVTWLLQCWDSGASSLELEGKEAKQLGSLSMEGGIDKAIGKGAPALSLWRRLLTMELTVLEVVYGDLDNKQLPKGPDEVRCTRPTWQKLVRNAPVLYANSMAVLTGKDREGPTVDELSSHLWEYKESISSSLVSAVEKLVQQLKEDRSYSPSVRTNISAI